MTLTPKQVHNDENNRLIEWTANHFSDIADDVKMEDAGGSRSCGSGHEFADGLTKFGRNGAKQPKRNRNTVRVSNGKVATAPGKKKVNRSF